MTALIHDWGESIIGDVDYAVKNANDEENEKEAFNKIVNELFQDEETRKLLLGTFDEIAMNRTTKLGKIFNAMERVGYITDALRMADHLEYNNYDEYSETSKTIIHAILKHQTEILIDYSDEYPFVKKFFIENKSSLKNLIKHTSHPEDQKYKRLWIKYLSDLHKPLSSL